MANVQGRSARALRIPGAPGAYAVCAAVALLAGCGHVSALEPQSPHVTTGFGVVAIQPGADSTNTPRTRVPANFRVERRTWGGMCAKGPCERRLMVTADGTWVLVVDGTRTTGTVSPKQVEILVMSVRLTEARVIQARTAQVATSAKPECAADHDGTSVAFAWTLGDIKTSVSSCDGGYVPVDDIDLEMDRLSKAIPH